MCILQSLCFLIVYAAIAKHKCCFFEYYLMIPGRIREETGHGLLSFSTGPKAAKAGKFRLMIWPGRVFTRQRPSPNFHAAQSVVGLGGSHRLLHAPKGKPCNL